MRLVKARPLPLESVRLTGGPLKHAQDLELEYLLALEPDRMLAFLRRSAKLEPKAQGYGGWDGDGRQLTGHIAGHYLSGVSLAWAATGDPALQRARRLHRQRAEAHSGRAGRRLSRRAHGPDRVDGKALFEQLSKGIIRSGGFDLNGMWSPWYVQHKIFAGLRDAYRHTGNRTALDVEIKFAAWAESILAPLSDEQIQTDARHRVRRHERSAGRSLCRYRRRALAGAGRQVPSRGRSSTGWRETKDILPGIHGNTQVPKLYGALEGATCTPATRPKARPRSTSGIEVTQHHTFATGGNTRNEYFGQPDQLSNMVDGRTAETCNVYNMIKMARTLFSVQPDIRYADYHERALFNHILASQDPDDGRVCYMVPVGRGVQHEYQGKFQSFTCCVGIGDGEPCAARRRPLLRIRRQAVGEPVRAFHRADWKSAGVKLEMSTDLPIGQTRDHQGHAAGAKKFTLALRRPFWAGDGFSVKVNGAVLKTVGAREFVRRNRADLEGGRHGRTGRCPRRCARRRSPTIPIASR